MTIREVLNLMDHEVWICVRIHDGREKDPDHDLVLWSADWISGGEDDPGMPKGLSDVLEWDADDLSIELHKTPENPLLVLPMIVVYAME